MRSRLCLIFLLLSGPSGLCLARDPALPDPQRTPGATNPQVTQANIHETICVKGWTRTIRPPESYTGPLKRQQMREYGYQDHRMRDFEEDHLIPLELGGAPQDPANLWPQPRDGAWMADQKDELESALRHRVCKGRMSLAEAQQAIRGNWIEAYQQLHLHPHPHRRPAD